MTKNNPNISSRAFWDTDFYNLDFQRHKNHIIQRVFEYGKWDDILKIISYYENKVITNTLLNAEFLSEKSLQLSSAIFKISKDKFKCFTKKPYHPSLKKR